MESPSYSDHAGAAKKYSSNRLLITALITGVLASAVSLFIIFGSHSEGTSPIGKYVFAPSELPFFPVALFDARTREVTLLTAEGSGTASIVGYAHGEDSNYYLLSEKNGEQSNVYALDLKNVQAGLSQRTFTSTSKYNISFDQQSGNITFETIGKSATSSVMVLTTSTTTEKFIAQGHKPVLLNGGQHVVYERGNKLYSASTDNGREYPLIDIPKSGAYAIDADALRAVVYEPSTKQFQYFTFKNFISGSFESSEPSGALTAQRILSLSDGKLTEFLTAEGSLLAPLKANKVDVIPNSSAYINSWVTRYEN